MFNISEVKSLENELTKDEWAAIESCLYQKVKKAASAVEHAIKSSDKATASIFKRELDVAYSAFEKVAFIVYVLSKKESVQSLSRVEFLEKLKKDMRQEFSVI
ncbi:MULTISPECIES: hypothetical protein [unclassified Paenibacillus]|uniref:hypothetical protein n=1 Tax=unclassified Paenibacillus TaxID=185978 RepID=UPI00020D7BA4|nr:MULTISPECIES: hypothetical protein [unclassified Paenibacillus]EGL18558.1 hypothetical protein HMPREF9413_5910 [Paenibacillus sp. HGF7]EPD80531.1 hypothetical protein HMPREF1207_05637 [Paenibacillus sp. HGH0039]